MTSHQDNAARLARIAQIVAVVVVLLAVGAFLISLPTEELSARSGAGLNNSPIDGGAEQEQYRFHVPEEDWTTAVSALSATRDPITVASIPNNGTDPGDGPGGDADDDDDNPPPRVPQNRPPIRYLGALGDDRGKAALIDFAGRQLFVRIGQEFENEYEITSINDDKIVVADGFNEFTIELEPSSLANALPNPILNPGRNRDGSNPNAFPGGRSTPPGRPTTPPAEDEEGGANT